MARPADPAVRARALELVADGHTCSAAARAVGVSQQAVRNWVNADTAVWGAWERSRVPDDLETAPGASESRCRGNGGRLSPLYVGFTGDREVAKPAELAQAMSRWRSRVAHYAVEDLEDRYLRAHDPCGR